MFILIRTRTVFIRVTFHELKVLGTVGTPCKRFEALSVFTVSPKRVEARGTATGHFLSPAFPTSTGF